MLTMFTLALVVGELNMDKRTSSLFQREHIQIGDEVKMSMMN